MDWGGMDWNHLAQDSVPTAVSFQHSNKISDSWNAEILFWFAKIFIIVAVEI
jgi:hypothetical protein